jgi:hypothetical protein
MPPRWPHVAAAGAGLRQRTGDDRGDQVCRRGGGGIVASY